MIVFSIDKLNTNIIIFKMKCPNCKKKSNIGLIECKYCKKKTCFKKCRFPENHGCNIEDVKKVNKKELLSKMKDAKFDKIDKI